MVGVEAGEAGVDEPRRRGHEAAGLLVDMQLGINDGWFFGGVPRTAGTATPTPLKELLKEAMP